MTSHHLLRLLRSSNSSAHLKPRLQRLWGQYFYPQRRLVYASCATMLVSALMSVALVQSLQHALDYVFKTQSTGLFYIFLIALFVCFVTRGLCTYFSVILQARVGHGVMAQLRQDIFAHITYLDFQRFTKEYSPGFFLSLINHDVLTVKEVSVNVFSLLARDVLSIVCLVGLVFYKDWRLALILLIMIPLATLPVKYIGRRTRLLSLQMQERTSEWQDFLHQILSHMMLVKSYNAESIEQIEANKNIQAVRTIHNKAIQNRHLGHPIVETLAAGALCYVLFYGHQAIQQGRHTLGSLLAFGFALLMCYEPLKRMIALHSQLQEGLISLARIFDFLDAVCVHNAKYAPSPSPQPFHTHNDHKDSDSARLCIKGLTFGYDTPLQKKQTLFHDFDLDIRNNEFVAIIGPNGAGKSTLFHILLGLYDGVFASDHKLKQCGIYVNDTRIDTLSLGKRRAYFTYVGQDNTCFHRSIAQNVAYGSLSFKDDDVIAALQHAGLWAFVESLPLKHHTLIGKNGIGLSGGQRQKLALSRAFFRPAPILLLDEITSALDPTSEIEIQNALSHFMQKRTTLMIAHKLKTVQMADRIVVLEGGRIIEQGSAAALWQLNGYYAQWARRQEIIEVSH